VYRIHPAEDWFWFLRLFVLKNRNSQIYYYHYDLPSLLFQGIKFKKSSQ